MLKLIDKIYSPTSKWFPLITMSIGLACIVFGLNAALGAVGTVIGVGVVLVVAAFLSVILQLVVMLLEEL